MRLETLIEQLSDESVPLSGILLRSKVYLHQIGKPELSEWARCELNGYPDEYSIPEYRNLPYSLLGNLSSYTFTARAHPLPIFHISDSIKKRFLDCRVTQSISTVEAWCAGENPTITRQVPMELNSMLAEVLSQGVVVQSAYVEMSTATVKNILLQVRSRLLDFFLELKSSIGEVSGEGDVKEKVREMDADGMFKQAIFGPNTTIVVGHGSSAVTNQTNSVVELSGKVQELVEQLASTLPTSGLSEETQSEARAAIGDLSAAVAAQPADPVRIRQGLGFLRKIMEGAAGNLVASGVVFAIQNMGG